MSLPLRHRRVDAGQLKIARSVGDETAPARVAVGDHAFRGRSAGVEGIRHDIFAVGIPYAGHDVGGEPLGAPGIALQAAGIACARATIARDRKVLFKLVRVAVHAVAGQAGIARQNNQRQVGVWILVNLGNRAVLRSAGQVEAEGDAGGIGHSSHHVLGRKHLARADHDARCSANQVEETHHVVWGAGQGQVRGGIGTILNGDGPPRRGAQSRNSKGANK